MLVLLSLSVSARRGGGGIQIRSFFFFFFKPLPPLSSLLFLCSALDSFMGWADKAIWKHVTGLVGATLHKCEDSERRSGEPLEQQQQQQPVSKLERTPRPLLLTF